MPGVYSSPDLAQLTRRAFDAVDRRDFDTALENFAADAVWESEVLETSFEGVGEIRTFLERWSLAYDAFEVQEQDISEFGGGVVLCEFVNRGGPDELEPPLLFALVIVWRDGEIATVIGSEDVAHARAAAERLAASR